MFPKKINTIFIDKLLQPTSCKLFINFNPPKYLFLSTLICDKSQKNILFYLQKQSKEMIFGANINIFLNTSNRDNKKKYIF